VPQQQRKLGPAAPALGLRAAAGRRRARGPVHARLLLQLALLLRGAGRTWSKAQAPPALLSTEPRAGT